ncbi:two-component system response regulator [Flavivirga sp. 57AJ16]|uniref:response regulator n=1 Tax=Flavivirga sp. 57AJ16 TaxID=3025307 RepID=UPI002365C6C0|nr:response regulator [Flavivirga sp. 57AJ16]MDD7884977.1 response regulator [Flavivirga sp. 57AJ16]
MKQIGMTCIIDDDPIFVFGAKRIMEIANFSKSVMIFNNGKEALDNLKSIITHDEDVPDIILLDINMPIMDGWQFLDEFIKIKTKKAIKVFVVSSSIDPADLKKAKKYEIIEDYILKPISVEKIKNIYKNLSKL